LHAHPSFSVFCAKGWQREMRGFPPFGMDF
jgi:hypothetical protein